MEALGQPRNWRSGASPGVGGDLQFPRLPHGLGREVGVRAAYRFQFLPNRLFPSGLTKVRRLRAVESGRERKSTVLLGKFSPPSVGADRPAARQSCQAQGFPVGFIPADFDEVAAVSLSGLLSVAKAAPGAPPGIINPAVATHDPSQATPAVIADMIGGDDFGTDGIQVDVVDDPSKRGRGLNQDGLIAALKKMPALLAEAIKSGCPSGLKPVHTLDKVGFGRFDSEMVVVGHQSVGVHVPPHHILCLADGVKEGLGFARRAEEVAAVISAINQVIDCAWELDPKLAGHDAELASLLICGKL